ncbi:MAG: GNAT family N-acetyltransferase [Chitinophagaceae bacterium]|nr:GNAT family N-acetyltransferase [Chitinophagaceae bacterium]
MNSELKISLLTSDSDFFAMEKEWNGLLQKSSADTIFLTWEWVSSWWKIHKKSNQQLFTLFIKEGNELIGIAPLYCSKVRFLTLLTAKRLDYIGFGTLDSEYMDFIIEKDKEKEVLTAVFNYLKQYESKWDVLYLNEMPESAVTLPLLSPLAAENGYGILETRHECSSVQLPGDWDTYLATMDSKFRYQLRHSTKRLEEGHTVEFGYCTSENKLADDLESLYKLHQKHWIGKDIEGSFINKQRQSFYYEISRLFLSKGWLRLFGLKVDGEYKAQQFSFEYAGKIFSLQEGYDPDWKKKRVGQVLRGYVFRDIISRGLTEYDFLGGISPHKKTWEAKAKYSVNLRISRQSFKTKLFLEIPVIVKKVRLAIKGLLPSRLVKLRRDYKDRQYKDNLKKRVNQQESTDAGE